MQRLVSLCLDLETEAAPSSRSDWNELVAAAAFHGVRPLLWKRVHDLDLPRAARTELAAFVAYNRFVIDALTREEERLRDELRAARIDHCLIKGTTFARRFYETAADREIGDIDLLISPGSLERTDRILAEIGYRAWMLPRARFGKSKEILYRNRTPDPCVIWVDLHQRLFSAVHEGELEARLLATSGSPDPAAELAYLAGHAAAHRLARLKYFVDLQRISVGLGVEERSRVSELVGGSPLGPGMSLALDRLEGLTSEATGRDPAEAAKPGSVRRWLFERMAGEDAIDHLARGPKLSGIRGLALGCLMVRGLGPRLRQLGRALHPDALELRQAYARSSTEPLVWVRLRRLTARFMKWAPGGARG